MTDEVDYTATVSNALTTHTHIHTLPFALTTSFTLLLLNMENCNMNNPSDLSPTEMALQE